MTIESKAIHVTPNKTPERHRSSRRVATKNEHFLTGREKVLWRPGRAQAPGFLCAFPCPRPLARTITGRSFIQPCATERTSKWIVAAVVASVNSYSMVWRRSVRASHRVQTGKVKGTASQSPFVLCVLLIVAWFLKEPFLEFQSLSSATLCSSAPTSHQLPFPPPCPQAWKTASFIFLVQGFPLFSTVYATLTN